MVGKDIKKLQDLIENLEKVKLDEDKKKEEIEKKIQNTTNNLNEVNTENQNTVVTNISVNE